jgi:DNA-directed RNA polymerase subunit L
MEINKISPTDYEFITQDFSCTLGALVQKELSFLQDVTFQGYSIPHPLETRMIIRIKTKENNVSKNHSMVLQPNPKEILISSLNNLLIKLNDLESKITSGNI